jgi:hypothetical protein
MIKSLFLLPILFFTTVLAAQNPDTSIWVPNNIVTKMCLHHDTLYMAGGFSQWGPNRPYGEIVDSISGIVNAGFPKPNGVVLTCEADGRGGYFIGGGFTQVGDSLRSRIAHIDGSGHVSSWKADVTSGTGIRSLFFDGTNLYVGGQFTVIDGQPRNNIAAIDTFGNILSWNPNANSLVDRIYKKNNKVYAAGFFTIIGGQSRQYLAQLDATTGLATAWNPNPNSYATGGIQVHGDRLFISGAFTTIGSASRPGLAALDTIAGLAFPFTITLNGGCNDFVAAGDSLMIGGYFTLINGQARAHFAVLDTSTGALRTWQPAFDAQPLKIVLLKNILFVGGQFKLVDNTRRNNACSFDMTSGMLTSWDPSCGAEVDDFCKTSWGICIAGRFPCINTIDRWQLAALDLSSRTFTPLQLTPGSIAQGQFHSMQVSSNRIYLGGTFDYINNQPRNGFAALNIQTGNLLPWNPNPTYSSGPDIKSFILKDSVIYVGGIFSTIGGQPRSHLACIDTVTGNALSWYPVPNNIIQTIFIHDSLIYIGGNFTSISAQSHQRIAAISLATALPVTWNPSVSTSGGQINNIHLLDTAIIVTGFFTTANAQPRANIAAFGISSGTLLPFNPVLNGGVDFSVLDSSTALYLSGQFTQVNSTSRNKIAAINPVSGNLKSWDLHADLGGLGFIADSNKVFVAGFFYTLGNAPYAYFIGVDAVPDTVVITSIHNQENNVVFNLFPNPTQDEVTIQLKNTQINSYAVTIYDINGRLVNTQHLQGQKSIIDFSNYNGGVYFLRLIADDNSVAETARVVITR